MRHIVIIGGGPGGYTAAFAAARAGCRVTLVEKDKIGGTCLHRGCVPTKTIKASADALSLARRLKEFGIIGTSVFEVNLSAVLARKDKVRATLQSGLEKACTALKIERVTGQAELARNSTVRVHTETGVTEYAADAVIIATGSHNLTLPALPVDHTRIITSDDALCLPQLPKRLLVVGGGVIGCELAFIFREFGVTVTIVEGQDRLLPLPSVDGDVSRLLHREAKKNGIVLELAATVQGVTAEKDGSLSCHLTPSPFVPDAKTQEKKLSTDMVLVAVGRIPSTSGLSLAEAGVNVDARGWITTDLHMQTSAPGIYAIGDVLGPSRVMLAHVASAEALCAVNDILGNGKAMDYSVIPSGIFTTPEIGTVGLSEEQARAAGHTITTKTFQLRELGKAQAMGDLAGFFKLIGDAKSGALLGAHFVGTHATDLIAEATLAIRTGTTISTIASTIHAHPTLAEGMYEAAFSLAGEYQ